VFSFGRTISVLLNGLPNEMEQQAPVKMMEDPLLESIVQKCTEEDPNKRPTMSQIHNQFKLS